MNSNENLIALFKDLDIDDKRNEYSNLLIKMNDILTVMLKELGNEENITVKNYDKNKDNVLDENEMLTFFYEDLWTIKNKLLLLYSLNKNK